MTKRMTCPDAAAPQSWIDAVRDVWRFRAFVIASIRRDVAAQFKGSLLGRTWLVLHPVALVAMYTLVFSRVMSERLPGTDIPYAYSVYVCAGLLPWTYHADCLHRLHGAFVGQANLLKKSQFPRLCLPVIALGPPTVNFAITWTVFATFLAVSGKLPLWAMGSLVPVMLVQLLMTLALGLLAATLNVFFRDVGQMIPVALLFWFWLTPVVYPPEILPPWATGLLWINPLAVLVQHHQHVLAYRTQAPFALWMQLLGWAIAFVGVLAMAWRTFVTRAPEMADEL